MRIYISIPISGQPIGRQRIKALEVAEQIRAIGHEPVNPFNTTEPQGDLSDKERYAYYMGEDVKLLLTCDAIFMCGGWENSAGCQAELSIAETYQLLRFNKMEDIPKPNAIKAEFEERLAALAEYYGVTSYFMQYKMDDTIKNVSGNIKV